MAAVTHLFERLFEAVEVLTVNRAQGRRNAFSAVRFSIASRSFILATLSQGFVIRRVAQQNQFLAPRFFLGARPEGDRSARDADDFLDAVPDTYNIFIESGALVRLKNGLGGGEIMVALVGFHDVGRDGALTVLGEDGLQAARSVSEAAASIGSGEKVLVLFHAALEDAPDKNGDPQTLIEVQS